MSGRSADVCLARICHHSRGRNAIGTVATSFEKGKGNATKFFPWLFLHALAEMN